MLIEFSTYDGSLDITNKSNVTVRYPLNKTHWKHHQVTIVRKTTGSNIFEEFPERPGRGLYCVLVLSQEKKIVAFHKLQKSNVIIMTSGEDWCTQ